MTEAIGVLLFGAFVLGIEVAVMIFRGRGWGPLSVRIFGVSLIVVATIFLAVSAIPGDRLSAAYAILGGAFGFLAGRSGNQDKPDE